MTLIDSVIDFMTESTMDEIELDSVCCAVLESDDTPRLLLDTARVKLDYHNYTEFVGLLFRLCMSMSIDKDFIGDTFWDLISDTIDGGVVEGDWEFTYTGDDDMTYNQVSYDETYMTAEWRVMYNFGHDLHWAWRETYDGSLEEMVNYCLCRVRDNNQEAWAAQNYPEIMC